MRYYTPIYTHSLRERVTERESTQPYRRQCAHFSTPLIGQQTVRRDPSDKSATAAVTLNFPSTPQHACVPRPPFPSSCTALLLFLFFTWNTFKEKRHFLSLSKKKTKKNTMCDAQKLTARTALGESAALRTAATLGESDSRKTANKQGKEIGAPQ